jgi:site-specific recombinase XerD
MTGPTLTSAIPSITVITRHSPECPHRAEGELFRKCKCRKHLRWSHDGKQYRISAKTRSWAEAEKAKRRKEDEYSGVGVAQPGTRKTVEQAVDLFLTSKRTEGIQPSVLGDYARELGRLRTFMESRGRYFLDQIRSEDAIEFQAEWPKNWSTQTQAHMLTRCRAFFRFCMKIGLIHQMPHFGKIRVLTVPTLPLSDEQFTVLLDTIPTVFPDTQNSGRKSIRIRSLVLLMRHSGLSLQDALTLKRESIEQEGDEAPRYRVVTQRTKTKTHVSVLIPPAIAQEILATPNHDPAYLFWNRSAGNGNPRATVIRWEKDFRKLFPAAGMPDGHSHQLRDTFAVNLLQRGVPLEEVSRLLGHTSIKTTEKHYSPWVQARQDRLDSLVLATF